MLSATPPKATNKLYVGNLSWGAESADLRALFEIYGIVRDAEVMKDKFTKRSRGFGFVTFDSEGCAEAAVSGLNKKEVNGRALRVDFATQKRGTETATEGVSDRVQKLSLDKTEKHESKEKGKRKGNIKQPNYITWTPEEELVWGEMIIKRYGKITELDRKLHFSLSSPIKIMTDAEFKLGMRRRVGLEPF